MFINHKTFLFLLIPLLVFSQWGGWSWWSMPEVVWIPSTFTIDSSEIDPDISITNFNFQSGVPSNSYFRIKYHGSAFTSPDTGTDMTDGWEPIADTTDYQNFRFSHNITTDSTLHFTFFFMWHNKIITSQATNTIYHDVPTDESAPNTGSFVAQLTPPYHFEITSFIDSDSLDSQGMMLFAKTSVADNYSLIDPIFDPADTVYSIRETSIYILGGDTIFIMGQWFDEVPNLSTAFYDTIFPTPSPNAYVLKATEADTPLIKIDTLTVGIGSDSTIANMNWDFKFPFSIADTLVDTIKVDVPDEFVLQYSRTFFRMVTFPSETSMATYYPPTSAEGNVYYVDATDGNDSNTGLSTTQAWKTISKVNGESFDPGDEILFKRGEVWRELLTVPSAGNSDSSIYISTYGSGDDPLIIGSDNYKDSTWTEFSTNLWYVATGDLSNDPDKIFLNGIKATEETDRANLNAQGEWYWTTSGDDSVFIYSTSDPSGVYSTIEIPVRAQCILANQQYVDVEGFELKYSADHGIQIWSSGGENNLSYINSHDNGNVGIMVGYCSNVTVTSCSSANNGASTASTNGPNISFDDVQGGTISYCVVDSAYSYGIMIFSNCDDILIEKNETFGNGQMNQYVGAGIALYADNDGSQTQDSIIVRYNYVHDELINGIFITNQVDTAQVYYNLISRTGLGTNNFGFGIYIGYDAGAGNDPDVLKIYNNTIYIDENSASAGCVGGVNNAVLEHALVKNNILYATSANAYTWKIQGDATNNPALDYNCFYMPNNSDGIKWENVDNVTWATLVGTYGQEVSGVNDNPDLVSPTTDFNLQTGSPCINTGTDVSLTRDFINNQIVGNPDIGAYEYGGSAGDSLIFYADFDSDPNTATVVSSLWSGATYTVYGQFIIIEGGGFKNSGWDYLMYVNDTGYRIDSCGTFKIDTLIFSEWYDGDDILLLDIDGDNRILLKSYGTDELRAIYEGADNTVILTSTNFNITDSVNVILRWRLGAADPSFLLKIVRMNATADSVSSNTDLTKMTYPAGALKVGTTTGSQGDYKILGLRMFNKWEN